MSTKQGLVVTSLIPQRSRSSTVYSSYALLHRTHVGSFPNLTNVLDISNTLVVFLYGKRCKLRHHRMLTVKHVCSHTWMRAICSASKSISRYQFTQNFCGWYTGHHSLDRALRLHARIFLVLSCVKTNIWCKKTQNRYEMGKHIIKETCYKKIFDESMKMQDATAPVRRRYALF